jgi:hypothetical protein
LKRLAVLLGVALVLASCGGEQNKYLAQQDERVYLRIPGDWNEIELAETDPDFLTDQTADATLLWRAGATGDPVARTVAELGTEHPFAIVKVYQIDGVLNQNMSVSLARVAGASLGFDPVLPSDEEKALAELIEYIPVDPKTTLQGSRAVYRSRTDAAADWETVTDMTTYFDPTTFRLYVLRVACDPGCFDTNADTITRIANSWSVEP